MESKDKDRAMMSGFGMAYDIALCSAPASVVDAFDSDADEMWGERWHEYRKECEPTPRKATKVALKKNEKEALKELFERLGFVHIAGKSDLGGHLDAIAILLYSDRESLLAPMREWHEKYPERSRPALRGRGGPHV